MEFVIFYLYFPQSHSPSPTTSLLLLLLLISMAFLLATATEDQQILSPFPSPPPATFRPSVAVIVGVLTALFSLTFLLLLYAKHCKRHGGYEAGGGGGLGLSSAAEHRNSGVARIVVESLPAFRFGALQGQKEGLECAVCLNRFEETEVLRLLPKCKHAFHVECVDVWLDAHSTCPLCRMRIHPEDVLLVFRENVPDPKPESGPDPVRLPKRISGRHSSAGEKCSGNSLVRVVVHDGGRKDGLLVTENTAEREEIERRFSHCIIVSDRSVVTNRGARRSDPRPSDLLFLQPDSFITGDGGRKVNTGLRAASEITDSS